MLEPRPASCVRLRAAPAGTPSAEQLPNRANMRRNLVWYVSASQHGRPKILTIAIPPVPSTSPKLNSGDKAVDGYLGPSRVVQQFDAPALSLHGIAKVGMVSGTFDL